MIKLFGIGNRLLCDDAIGVKVLEKLVPKIHTLYPMIEPIIGETDYLFCLDCILENDIVLIIDSTYINVEPGTISYFTFQECDRFINFSQSAHEMTLLKILRLEYPKVQGYLIGVEIAKVDFSLELSEALQLKLDRICREILQFLDKLVHTIYFQEIL